MSKLTIGADPEFCFVSPLNGQVIPAHTFLEDNGRTKLLGLDGNSSTAEIRPNPAENPLELVENIFKILETGKLEAPEAFRNNLMASSTTNSIGGHIHLGHPDISNTSANRASSILKVVNNLDFLLSIPVSLVEIPDHRKKRLSSYGKLGDRRTEFPFGFEYRTLASWLSSKELAQGVLSLAYAIAHNTLIDKQELKKMNKYPYEEVKYLFNSGYSTFIKSMLPDVVTDIKSLPLYNEYKKPIDYIIRSSKEGRPLLATEIKEGWGIKFLQISDLKLSNLASLVERIGKALTLSVLDSTTKTLITWGSDWRVEDIAQNTNNSLTQIVGADVLSAIPNIITWKLRGLKAETGNKIIITGYKQNKQLSDLIVDLYTGMGRMPKDLTIKFESEGERCIYLPRTARARTDYLCEAICSLVWLYTNREAYKSKTQTKKGKTIALPFSSRVAVRPLIKAIKGQKRLVSPSISELTDDDTGTAHTRVINFAREVLLPRVEQAERDNRPSIRVTQSIYRMLEATATSGLLNRSCPECSPIRSRPTEGPCNFCLFNRVLRYCRV